MDMDRAEKRRARVRPVRQSERRAKPRKPAVKYEWGVIPGVYYDHHAATPFDSPDQITPGMAVSLPFGDGVHRAFLVEEVIIGGPQCEEWETEAIVVGVIDGRRYGNCWRLALHDVLERKMSEPPRIERRRVKA